MRYLLDTNIVSELQRTRPHLGVLAWFAANKSAYFATPSIALFELQMGVGNVEENDPERAATYDLWIGRVEAETNILPLDAPAAREAARLLYKLPMDRVADAMIAGIARVHGLTVATRNVRHFRELDVPIVNPFDHR